MHTTWQSERSWLESARLDAPGKGYAAATGAKSQTNLNNAKNVTLFFAAPFIGLAYLLAFPVAGLAMIAWIACKAVMKSKTARHAALVITAPFIALAFVTISPIAGNRRWSGSAEERP